MNKNFKFLIVIFFILFFENNHSISLETKIKVGLLVPLTGEDEKLGKLIIKSTRMAIEDLNTNVFEIYPKDTGSNPDKTIESVKSLNEMGVNIVVGPIFYKNLNSLKEFENITFLSLTNRTLDISQNIISSGVNATSQLNAIKNFIKLKELNKTIFLTPELDYKIEIKKGIKQSRIKINKHHLYETEPTKLTKQIEKITNYKIRKQNLIDEITRIENSNDPNKENKINLLKKKYTLGDVDFDSIVISDFQESLKSVITSFLYSDVSPKKKYFITFNQWFDESLVKEENIQPLYYPSINRENLESFKNKFFLKYNEYPNHLSLLSYDLIGLIYYLSLKDGLNDPNKLFKKKNSFKGKIGIFNVENNKINHKLNFYKIDNGETIKIF
tara:strand:- start:835 stop:1989 length:1155 start_codon:yes stop_codon:yes gene_type:complete